jgi:predicted metalloendopeptidase
VRLRKWRLGKVNYKILCKHKILDRAKSLKLADPRRVFYYNRLREKIDRKSWLEHSDVSVVNAFYNGDGNFIEFPAGILQGLFFNANVPRYMNFAAIGAIIGHEITHGFDDKGKQRNAKGNSRESFFSGKPLELGSS